MKILGREPAQWLACIAIVVQLAAGAGLPLSEGQQAALNAAATAAFGFALAWTVAREKLAAAAGGLVGALLQLAVSLGAHISQDSIAAIGAGITALLAWWLYGKVTAPVAADGSTVPPERLTSRT